MAATCGVRIRTLELFSGTGSFSKAVHTKWIDAETTTVDLDPGARATHTTNLLDFNYKLYPPGYFDVVWSSPPCTEYSQAKTVGVRDLKTADALVRRTWEIILYLKPRAWFIENPASGQLVSRMRHIHLAAPLAQTTDYCQWGYCYRKHTAIWSNVDLGALPRCGGQGYCPVMVDGRHPVRIQGWTLSINLKNSVPPRLLSYLLDKTGELFHSALHENAVPAKLLEHVLQSASEHIYTSGDSPRVSACGSAAATTSAAIVSDAKPRGAEMIG